MISEQHFRLKKNGEPYSECFCRHPEKIENYDKAIADETQIWECHHRREELYSRKELIERREYFDVKPEELIFLTREEHNKMDSMCKRNSEAHKGKTHSEEVKRKIGEASKGRSHKVSEEAKRRMSEAHKGKPSWNKGKAQSEEQKRKFSEAHKGKHWKLVDGKRVYY